MVSGTAFYRFFGVLLFGGSLLLGPSLALADCTIQTGQGTIDAIANIGDSGGSINGVATEFVASCSGDVSSITMSLARTAGYSGDVHVSIYDDSGGKPGTIISTVDGTISGGSLNIFTGNSDLTDESLSGLTATLVNGTTYWVALFSSTQSGTFYGVAGGERTGSNTWSNSTDGGSTWAGPYSNGLFRMTLNLISTGGGSGTTTIATTTTLTADDQLFLWGVMLFFVSLIGWGVIFRPMQNI